MPETLLRGTALGPFWSRLATESTLQALLEHLFQTVSIRSSRSCSWTTFRPYEVSLLDHHLLSAPLGIATPKAGCFGTHASALTPPQSISIPALNTSVLAPSSRTPR